MVVEELEGIGQDAIDFYAEDNGSIILLRPATNAAVAWAEEFLPEDAPRFGNAYAVERNFICTVLNGIEGDGLKWQAR